MASDSDSSGNSASKECQVNEDLANQIQKEWLFRLIRIPETIIIRCGIVVVALVFLETLLIISNNLQYLGFWELLSTKSTEYRNALTKTKIGRSAHLDSESLDKYSLWRGWVVPSFLAGSTYIIVSLLSLRHELYHWKPELLSQYLEDTKLSKIGKLMPSNWLEFAFHVYDHKHRKYVDKNIQKRTHVALDDSAEFLKVLRVVGLNIILSSIAILVFWILLLQTNIETENIIQLPPSYLPPLQAILWYFMNDLFYFYPHWIAHHGPATDAFYFKIFPRTVAESMYTYFNQSHRLHHKTKANLGLAAWYCSPWEQIIFNLFPALIGPYLNQVVVDTLHLDPKFGVHLGTLYVWLMAASASSVLAHTGFRSCLNDPGKHDLHHERAFNPKTAVNFGTLGFFDWLHGTASSIPVKDAREWREQRGRQAALWEASRRSGVRLTREQKEVVKQPDHNEEWLDKNI